MGLIGSLQYAVLEVGVVVVVAVVVVIAVVVSAIWRRPAVACKLSTTAAEQSRADRIEFRPIRRAGGD